MQSRHLTLAAVQLLAGAALVGAWSGPALASSASLRDAEDSNALIMTAEIALQRDDCGRAAANYTIAAQRLTDAKLAERAAGVALDCGQSRPKREPAATRSSLSSSRPRPPRCCARPWCCSTRGRTPKTSCRSRCCAPTGGGSRPGRRPRPTPGWCWSTRAVNAGGIVAGTRRSARTWTNLPRCSRSPMRWTAVTCLSAYCASCPRSNERCSSAATCSMSTVTETAAALGVAEGTGQLPEPARSAAAANVR